MGEARLFGVVIFDNNPKDAVLYPNRTSFARLEVIYSPNRLSADEYILEYIETLPKKRSTTVETFDN